MSEQNKRIVRRFVEQGAGKNDVAVIEETLHPDFVHHNPMPGLPPDREGAKLGVAGFRAAFPDYELRVVDLVAEGDKVVSRIGFAGTNTGSLMGMPPTGKRVEMEFWHLERLEGGRIRERWSVMDNMLLMRQLGLAPG